MHRLTGTRRWSPLGIAAVAVMLGIAAWTVLPTPAAAQFWWGFGPRYYAPFPYYYPPPAYYPYYPPPPAAYYPPPASAYGAPPAAAGAAPEPTYGAPAYGAPATAAGAPGAAPAGAAAITYTNRPAFKNAAGETCREYRGANGTLGSACQDAAGQWRIAN
jgi:hypothetical protein